LPGVSSLSALTATARLDLSTVETVLTLLAINAIMLMLLEIPLIGYTVSPQRSAALVERLTVWLSRDGAKIGLVLAIVLALALIARGVAGLLG
jgi:precorrin-2 methylase